MSSRFSGHASVICMVLGAVASSYGCSDDFGGCSDTRSCPGGAGSGGNSGGSGGSSAGKGGNDNSAGDDTVGNAGSEQGVAGSGQGGELGQGGSNPGQGGSDPGQAGSDGGGQGGSDGGGQGGSDGGGQGGANEAGAGGSAWGPDTVRGFVRLESGDPLADWAVVVDGVSVTTNDDGEFVVHDVADEYDLLVSPTADHLRFYQGLSTREPIVFMKLRMGDPGYLPRIAQVSGSVTNMLAGQYGIEQWIGGRPSTTALGQVAGTSYSYNQQISWNHDQDPLAIELFVVSSDGVNWRTGSKELSISAAGAYTNQDILLVQHGTHSITTSLQNDSGIAPVAFFQCLSEVCAGTQGPTFPVTAAFPLGFESSRGVLSRTFAGPIAGPNSGAVARVHDDDTEVALEMHAPPTLFGPVDGAEVGVATQYDWSPYAGDAVYTLSVRASGYLLEVVTKNTNFALSMIDGATYKEGSLHTWQLTAAGPFLSLDELVAGKTQNEIWENHHVASAAERTFTP